jgi:hypothetical protein
MTNPIVRRMQELGVNQAWLVRNINSSKAAVSRYLEDDADNKLSTLKRIARALDCSIVDLISDTPISANKDLNVTEMQHIIEICSDVIFQELKANIDPKIFAEIIIDVYKWAKEENANDNDVGVFLKGILRYEKRISNKGES